MYLLIIIFLCLAYPQGAVTPGCCCLFCFIFRFLFAALALLYVRRCRRSLFEEFWKHLKMHVTLLTPSKNKTRKHRKSLFSLAAFHP